jgi:hypothetical protein
VTNRVKARGTKSKGFHAAKTRRLKKENTFHEVSNYIVTCRD